MPKNNSGEGSVLEHLEALRSALWKSVAAVAAGLSNALWCRKNRREIAQIEQRIAQREAKNEAREKKKAAQAAARTGQQA